MNGMNIVWAVLAAVTSGWSSVVVRIARGRNLESR